MFVCVRGCARECVCHCLCVSGQAYVRACVSARARARVFVCVCSCVCVCVCFCSASVCTIIVCVGVTACEFEFQEHAPIICWYVQNHHVGTGSPTLPYRSLKARVLTGGTFCTGPL